MRSGRIQSGVASSVAVGGMLAGVALGGTGTMRLVEPGVWALDFCVSVRFDATPAELQRVREAFTLGSPILADATDGQVRFGRISIFNDSQGGPESEVWIFPEEGRAMATLGLYGDYGQHIVLYYGSNIDNASIQQFPDRAAYTMAHEFAHHLWAVRDEYSGPACQQSGPLPFCQPLFEDCCDCEASPASPTATFCLMDNYFLRGGNLGSDPTGTGTYTLNEFCIAANHDPDGDSFQADACWVAISTHPDRPLADPGVPMDPAGAAPPDPQFFEDVEDPRFVLCMDTSGSMSSQDLDDTASRLLRLQQAGHLFVNLLRDGDELGIVAYDATATPVFPLQAISSGDDRQAAKDVIVDFEANGATAIGLGLEESIDLLAPLSDSCTQRIILCSDGFGNTGPDELDSIPTLLDERLPTTCLAIGGAVNEASLKEIAYRTGGAYARVIADIDIPTSYAFAYAEMSELEIQSQVSGSTSPPPISFFTTVQEVNPRAFGTTFAVVWRNLDADLQLSIVAPDGETIDEMLAGAEPDVDYRTGIGNVVLDVRRQYPDGGVWAITALSTTSDPTELELLTFVTEPDVSLAASTDRRVYPCGEPIQIVATPRFGGRPVRGVDVSATVTRPSGVMQTAVLLDDGVGPDALPDDGIYSTQLPPTAEAGGIRVEVFASHAGGGITAEGEPLFAPDPISVVFAPPFERFERTFAVVTCLRADVNGDMRVDLGDLNLLLANWSAQVTPFEDGDTDGNGLVDIDDLNQILSAWGTGVPVPGE